MRYARLFNAIQWNRKKQQKQIHSFVSKLFEELQLKTKHISKENTMIRKIRETL